MTHEAVTVGAVCFGGKKMSYRGPRNLLLARRRAGAVSVVDAPSARPVVVGSSLTVRNRVVQQPIVVSPEIGLADATESSDGAKRPRGKLAENPHVLIIVQNLPVPLDRRVWLECQALVSKGYEVSVICPKGPGDSDYQRLDGVDIYKYRPAREAAGLAGFAWEFAYSWVRTAALSTRVWRKHPFTIMQACNPPDTYWLLARLWRPFGVVFVFDHHDLNPELFRSRFGEPQGVLQKIEYRALLFLERMSLRTAKKVISTNDSYRSVAISRGGRRPEDVTVVRSCPDTSAMRPIHPEHPHNDGEINLVYLGIMGPQDGVDRVLLVVDELVHRRGRTNITVTMLGFGDCYKDLCLQAKTLKLDDRITFTGRVDRSQIAEYLSRADVGLCPDPKTPLNDLSTMNKTMEYMAYGLPSVAFDLAETRISGGDCVLYVPCGDISGFADAVESLMDNPGLRVDIGRRARERVAKAFDWRQQAEAYVSVFDELSGLAHSEPALAAVTQAEEVDQEGRRYVRLDVPTEVELYLAMRR